VVKSLSRGGRGKTRPRKKDHGPTISASNALDKGGRKRETLPFSWGGSDKHAARPLEINEGIAKRREE